MAGLAVQIARRLGAVALSASVVALCVVGAFALLVSLLAIIGRVAG
jgi:hypothetical protein